MERNNRTIQTALLKTLKDSTEDWPNALPGVLFAYRTSVQKSTGYTPFFLLYGRNATLPIEVNIQCTEGQSDKNPLHSDGTNTSSQDGTNTSSQDGTNTSSQDGTNTSSQDGTNTSSQDGTLKHVFARWHKHVFTRQHKHVFARRHQKKIARYS